MDTVMSYAKQLKKTEAGGYLMSLTTKVKQMALNLTDLEVKVEEATNNEPWGPHGSVMAGTLCGGPVRLMRPVGGPVCGGGVSCNDGGTLLPPCYRWWSIRPF